MCLYTVEIILFPMQIFIIFCRNFKNLNPISLRGGKVYISENVNLFLPLWNIMVSIHDHCVDLIAILSSSTYCEYVFLYYGSLIIKETQKKFQMLFSVNMWAIKVGKLFGNTSCFMFDQFQKILHNVSIPIWIWPVALLTIILTLDPWYLLQQTQKLSCTFISNIKFLRDISTKWHRIRG